MKWVSHVAGPDVDGQQRCARCGDVLVDDTRTARTSDGHVVDRLYGRGGPVVRLLGLAGAVLVTAPARPGRLPTGSRPCTPTGAST